MLTAVYGLQLPSCSPAEVRGEQACASLMFAAAGLPPLSVPFGFTGALLYICDLGQVDLSLLARVLDLLLLYAVTVQLFELLPEALYWVSATKVRAAYEQAGVTVRGGGPPPSRAPQISGVGFQLPVARLRTIADVVGELPCLYAVLEV